MNRLPILVVVALGLTTTASAQAPSPAEPTIEISISTQSGPPGSGTGTATVSGKVNLPPGWTLSVHTLTLRAKKAGTATTLNAFLPVKGHPHNFKVTLQLPSGSHAVWGIIDVKDPNNKTKEISSPVQSAPIGGN
jgi:hypothetical protein